MADNWLQQELAAERAAQDTAAISDQPGYDHAQTLPLESLAMGDKSHREIAGIVRMLMRTDLQHEAVCLAARDRIAWLAAQGPEWHPIDENTPQNEQLLLSDGAVVSPGCVEIDDDGEIYCPTSDHSSIDAKYWSPMPKGPLQVKGKGNE